MSDATLNDWRGRALDFEHAVRQVVVGMDAAIRHITLAVFARGHVMLEGDVGVGKTTLLRAVARGIGGAYERRGLRAGRRHDRSDAERPRLPYLYQ